MTGSADTPGATFRDHFSGSSQAYARFRPTYPPALYAELAARAPARTLAWDCATGSGQAAIGLADYFDRIIATDPSAQQLAAATAHARVEYRRGTAEASGLDARSATLVAVAQALHWFDLPRFYDEVRRVLVPRGIIAAWGYGLVTIAPAIDALLGRFYAQDVGPWWPPERRMVDDRYATVDFPFEPVELPSFAIERQISLGDLAGYLRTWSATQRFVRARGFDPVAPLENEIALHWGDPDSRRHAAWPLFIRAGRV